MKWANRNDPQRHLVYRWSGLYLINTDTEHLPINTCNFLTEDIFTKFGMKKIPQVIHSIGQKANFYYPKTNIIKLIEPSRNRIVLTHEIAHALKRRIYKKRGTSHGPEYIGIWMFLLNKWCNIPIKDLCRTADYEGVEYIPFNFKLKTRPSKALCTLGNKNTNCLISKKIPTAAKVYRQDLYPGGYGTFYE
jgi:hypothetical protein